MAIAAAVQAAITGVETMGKIKNFLTKYRLWTEAILVLLGLLAGLWAGTAFGQSVIESGGDSYVLDQRSPDLVIFFYSNHHSHNSGAYSGSMSTGDLDIFVATFAGAGENGEELIRIRVPSPWIAEQNEAYVLDGDVVRIRITRGEWFGG